MTISKMLMVETGTYNDQVIRPYKSNFDANMGNLIAEATQYGTVFTPNAMAMVATNALKPMAQVRGLANIPNGWGERRFRFMMEYIHDAGFGTQRIFIVTGFTNYVGATHNGAIDHNMEFYINNIIEVRSVMMNTPLGMQYQQTVNNASQILPAASSIVMPVNDTGYHGYNPVMNADNMPHMLRPVDLVSGMQSLQLNDPELIDFRAVAPPGVVKKSRRANTNPAQYLSKTLSALNAAYQHTQLCDSGGDYGSIIEHSKSSLSESTANDTFLLELGMKTMFNGNGYVTWGELLRCWPEIDACTKIIFKGEVQKTSIMAERGMTEHMVGSNIQTIAATILSQSVLAIMMDLMITKVTFVATNETLDGSVAVDIRDGRSFSTNMEMGPYFQVFIDRLIGEVLMDVSHHGQFSFNLQMIADVLGDTYITISLNGSPAIDYVIPSFCDALITPVIGSSKSDFDTLAYDVDQMFTFISDMRDDASKYSKPTAQNTIGGSFDGSIDFVL